MWRKCVGYPGINSNSSVNRQTYVPLNMNSSPRIETIESNLKSVHKLGTGDNDFLVEEHLMGMLKRCYKNVSFSLNKDFWERIL